MPLLKIKIRNSTGLITSGENVNFLLDLVTDLEADIAGGIPLTLTYKLSGSNAVFAGNKTTEIHTGKKISQKHQSIRDSVPIWGSDGRTTDIEVIADIQRGSPLSDRCSVDITPAAGSDKLADTVKTTTT